MNPFLMELLRIVKAVDELGRGKSVIFSEAIKEGKPAPEVIIESAGKYDRWKLTIFGGGGDEKLLRLLDRSRVMLKDEQRALISQALVLWRDKPVNEIKDYVDGDFARKFAESLLSVDGPTFYEEERDRIILRRWARVLLGEGKDSKALSPGEEREILQILRGVCLRDSDGIVTPKDLRSQAAMSNTPSESSLSSDILKKWEKEGYVEKVGHGKCKFYKNLDKDEELARRVRVNFEDLMKILSPEWVKARKSA